jgi:hypothetical protein
MPALGGKADIAQRSQAQRSHQAMTLVRPIKFPDLVTRFPVVRQIFPVPLIREFAQQAP